MLKTVGEFSRQFALAIWWRFNTASDRAFDASYEFVDDAVDQTLSCVECGSRVKLLDRFCSTCDQAKPARLHWKAFVLLIGVPAVLALILIALQ